MLPLARGAKREKMTRNAKKMKRNTPVYTFRFLHFESISCYFTLSV